MEALKLVSMNGGDGDGSYAQNSGIQNYGFHAYGKPYLTHAIQLYKENNPTNNKHIPQPTSSRLICIADYGCGYGRNTLECAQFIISKILELDEEDNGHVLKEETTPRPRELINAELQYFFVDLPDNDFNSLFRMLHSPDCVIDFQGLKFFATGVPGSFYERVLPERSVDFATTTYSIHWLSQVPAALLDQNAPTWNGGHVWIPRDDGGAVSQAYAKQFQEDSRRFLRSRAEEMRSNGVMFILSLCHTQETSSLGQALRVSIFNGIFEQAWNELVEEGIVEASERDTFNLPYYNFCISEFEEALHSISELELLELHVLEKCDHLVPLKTSGGLLLPDLSSLGVFWSSFLRSLIEPIVDAHIGKTRASQLFDRVQAVVMKNGHLVPVTTSDLLIAIIRRK